MAGRMALVGGDEFRSGCEEMDSEILKATGKSRPRVLIIPTAAVEGNPAKAAANGVNHFASLGAEAEALMVLNSADADDSFLVSAIDDADLIYLTGGNPRHLLDTLRGSELLSRIEKALEGDAILVGSSAGAMVMGSWMRFREWSEALGLVSGTATLPHHERANPADTAAELGRTAPSDITALGIDGMSGCLGSSGSWTALGSGAVTVYGKSGWQRYTAGDKFSLS